jgi:acyl carrier protein
MACDVADARALRRALDVTSAHMGPLNGVLHLAGVPGDGIQLLRSPERAAEVLRPKVIGTLQLQELLAELGPLDFFVTFSSRASLNGLFGGGDYAAANAFIDALSGTGGALPGTRQLSINWPAWARVGMAAAAAGQVPAVYPPPTAPGQELVWETVLDADGTWELDEHRLDGVPVLPGTAHLDLVVRAFRELVQPSGTAVRIEEAVIHRPLVVPASCRLRVVLRRDALRWRFRMESVDEAGARTHTSGRIEWCADSPRQIGLEALRMGFAEAKALDTRRSGGQTFTLGRRWDALVEVLQAGTEKIVRIELPERFADDLQVHPLHPAVLDCATAAARDPGEGAYMPFMYRSLVLHGELPGAVVSHLRCRSTSTDTIVADIDIIARDGTVVAEIEGYAMRRFDPEAIVRGPGQDAVSAEQLASTGAPSASASGIDPDEGVRLLLDLLAARTPAQVAVRPFEDGQPVALDRPLRQAAALPRPTVEATAIQPAPAPATASATGAGPVPSSAATGIGDTVAAMREIWELTLGATEFAVSDNFFDAGGTSLSAIELMTRIRDRFGVELSIATLLDSPTIESLASELFRQLNG